MEAGFLVKDRRVGTRSWRSFDAMTTNKGMQQHNACKRRQFPLAKESNVIMMMCVAGREYKRLAATDAFLLYRTRKRHSSDVKKKCRPLTSQCHPLNAFVKHKFSTCLQPPNLFSFDSNSFRLLILQTISS
jgi:hypothetical protein